MPTAGMPGAFHVRLHLTACAGKACPEGVRRGGVCLCYPPGHVFDYTVTHSDRLRIATIAVTHSVGRLI